MKKIILFILIITIASSCKNKTEDIGYELIKFYENGKWGVINKNGEIIKKAQYLYVGNLLCNRMKLVDENDKITFINEKGEEAFKCNFIASQEFCENRTFVLKENNKIALIDENGREIKEIDLKVAKTSYFKNGYAKLTTDIGDTYFIDLEGNILFIQPPDNGFVGNVISENLIAFYKNENDKIKCGFLDLKGKVVIDPIYDLGSMYNYQCAFENGLACLKKEGKTVFIDKNGKEVLILNYNSVSNFQYDFAIFQSENNKNGIIDKKGNIIIPPIYKHLRINNENSFIFESDNKLYGLIDTKGEILIPAKYSEISEFVNGISIVNIDEFNGKPRKFAVINEKGEFVLMPKFFENSSNDDLHNQNLYDFNKLENVTSLITEELVNPKCNHLNEEFIKYMKSKSILEINALDLPQYFRDNGYCFVQDFKLLEGGMGFQKTINIQSDVRGKEFDNYKLLYKNIVLKLANRLTLIDEGLGWIALGDNELFGNKHFLIFYNKNNLIELKITGYLDRKTLIDVVSLIKTYPSLLSFN